MDLEKDVSAMNFHRTCPVVFFSRSSMWNFENSKTIQNQLLQHVATKVKQLGATLAFQTVGPIAKGC